MQMLQVPFAQFAHLRKGKAFQYALLKKALTTTLKQLKKTLVTTPKQRKEAVDAKTSICYCSLLLRYLWLAIHVDLWQSSIMIASENGPKNVLKLETTQ